MNEYILSEIHRMQISNNLWLQLIYYTSTICTSHVRVDDGELCLFLFLFLFLFILFFELKIKVQYDITHDYYKLSHRTQNIVEGSRIIMSSHMSTACSTHISLEQAKLVLYKLFVKIKESGLSFFLFSFQFIFHCFYFQNSGIRIRSDWSHCHISHI